MADDNGIVADIEAAIVAALTAITLSSETVFRTVDHAHFQLMGGDSFRRYAPFAFVLYDSCSRQDWEGNGELRNQYVFNIMVGTEITKAKKGAARIGKGTDASDRELGISRMRDLVITALQDTQLSTTVGDIEQPQYLGDRLVWSHPQQAAIIMQFQIDRIGA